MKISISSLFLLSLVGGITAAPSTLDVVGYWGVHGGQVGEKNLGYYCDTGAYTIINLSFIDALSNPHNITADLPAADPSNGDVVADIKHCQANGVRIFISIGGYIANVPITDDATGEAYADGLWNTYFGGKDSSYTRPFGSSVVLDGLDLDLEQSSVSGYGALVKKLKSYFDNSGQAFYLSAAPQCGIPDPNMDTLLKTVWFDYVNPQFYNNWCYFTGPNFNYENVSSQFGPSWVAYAPNFVNPNTKLLLGVPAPGGGNGGDYDVLSKVQTVVPDLASKNPDLFGGVMFWDCFWAGPTWANSVRAVVDQACGGKCTPGKPPSSSTSASSTPTSTSSSKSTSTTTSTTTSTVKTTTSTTSSTTKIKTTSTTTTTKTKTSSSTSSPSSSPTGGSCSTTGQMVCTSPNNSPAFTECVNGQWESYTCSPGTVCQTGSSGIYCGFQTKRGLRARRGLRL